MTSHPNPISGAEGTCHFVKRLLPLDWQLLVSAFYESAEISACSPNSLSPRLIQFAPIATYIIPHLAAFNKVRQPQAALCSPTEAQKLVLGSCAADELTPLATEPDRPRRLRGPDR